MHAVSHIPIQRVQPALTDKRLCETRRQSILQHATLTAFEDCVRAPGPRCRQDGRDAALLMTTLRSCSVFPAPTTMSGRRSSVAMPAGSTCARAHHAPTTKKKRSTPRVSSAILRSYCTFLEIGSKGHAV